MQESGDTILRTTITENELFVLREEVKRQLEEETKRLEEFESHVPALLEYVDASLLKQQRKRYNDRIDHLKKRWAMFDSAVAAYFESGSFDFEIEIYQIEHV